ncbi:MAG: aspartate dehydrogenase [Candidatus Thermoplasmatota archaeon]|nr:aspartate dehydrogenase [Candidatus Thermoplasmatota archaeon]
MRLGIIGCGAIGTDVAKAADAMTDIEKIYLFDIKPAAAKHLCSQVKKASIKPVKDFLEDVDLVFEAASQEAVIQFAAAVLEASKDLIIMSIGSLFDDAFRKKIVDIARKHHRKIYLPSGAVCGIDGVMAASIEKLDSVTLVTTKPPASLGKTVEERTVVYKGTARDAVKQFPRNINVAACLSLAGVGFDETIVEIVADPVETRINHKILAHGRFGRLRAEVENMPNPNNPQSSYMASLSAIATLRRVLDPLQIA